MRPIRLFAGIAFFALLLVTGCKKEQALPESAPSINALESKAAASKPTARMTAEVRKKLDALRSKLPKGAETRLKQNAAKLLQTHPEYRSLVRRALAVEPTECDGNTPLVNYLNDQLADWDELVIFYALATGMLDFPTIDALLFENSSDNQYYGVTGDFTQRVNKTFKDLKRFWNIESDNIIIAAMHGSMLRDREKVIRVDMILYGDSRERAEYWADLILFLMDNVPQYRNGNHPIFTFNAFAQDSFNFPPYGVIPKKIIMGDGILEAYAAIGYSDVAPQAILAHEFGHHIQFQLNLFGSESSPEATRRTELMADAFSAYYLSHARGASMQWKRVQQFLQVFFNIGDCAFTNDGHHGTPLQRMASAQWAYSVADNAQKQGHILTAQQFTKMFDAKLPSLVQ